MITNPIIDETRPTSLYQAEESARQFLLREGYHKPTTFCFKKGSIITRAIENIEVTMENAKELLSRELLANGSSAGTLVFLQSGILWSLRYEAKTSFKVISL